MSPPAPNGHKKLNREDPQAKARRMSNYIRLLEFLVAITTLAVGIQNKIFPFDYILVIAILLAYPLIAQVITAVMERRSQLQQQTVSALIQIDAVFIGLTMATLHFTVVPCIALLIIVNANAVTGGGLFLWLMSFVWVVVGAFIGTMIVGFQIIPLEQTPSLLTLVSLLGLGVYVAAASLNTHQQTKIVLEAQENLRHQQKQAVELSRKLAKYLSPQIWGSLFSGRRDAKVETRRKKLTVFFSDIKGFSAMSEDLPLEKLTSMLNTYLSEMTRIAERHGGTVDKFIGDAVMVFFGDPSSKGSKEDATACVAMAIEMQKHMKLLRQRWTRDGIDQRLEIRIGINTGYVTVGNFGTDTRLDYTILGTDVNLASRLESAARPGHILVSQATHELVKDRILCRDVGEITAKGFNRPIPVYEVVDFRSKAGKYNDFISLEADGFGIHLNVDRVRNFDKKRILHTLAKSASELKKAEDVEINFEAEGFAIHLNSHKINPKDRSRILQVMGEAAMTVKERLIV